MLQYLVGDYLPGCGLPMLRLELRLYACIWHVDYLNRIYGATHYTQNVVAIRNDGDSPVVAIADGGEYEIGIGLRAMVLMDHLDVYLQS